MSDNTKLYSEMERFELININDGDKYNYLGNNDVIIDQEGQLKYILLNESSHKFTLFKNNEIIEIPWECVKRIGSKTIIIDIDSDEFKRSKV
ncbi:MAG TPA: YlmC/YmxH family sporulation protein [Clostridiaceae bacterium]